VKNGRPHNLKIDEVQGVKHHGYHESEETNAGRLIQRRLQEAVHDISREAAQKRGGDRDQQGTGNAIWMIIVTTFAIVLIGSAVTLFYGVLGTSKTTELQILLTIFTTVVGFLAGLLSPSPLQKASPSA